MLPIIDESLQSGGEQLLVDISDQELAELDIAFVNLVCARGLPGAEALDIPRYMGQLDDWASLVDYGTRRMFPKFVAGPEEYNNSEGYFRMLVMATVLQRNLGARYNPACREGEADFRDPRVQFVHGLLDGFGGTCASMPVLYVAIGRRLGYPLKLVGAKAHLFVRWEDDGERFNIEAATDGLGSHPDEYYHTFPIPLTEEDLRKGYYLYSYSRRQELACFIAAKGTCFLDNMRWMEALQCFCHACEMEPGNPNYRGHWAEATVLFQQAAGLADYGLHGNSPPNASRPLEWWEEQMIPQAKKTLKRIESLHRPVREEIFSKLGEDM